MTLNMGPDTVPKRAAWAAIEGSLAMGQVTGWENGECDVEVYATESGDSVLRESLKLASVEELGVVLRRALNACE